MYTHRVHRPQAQAVRSDLKAIDTAVKGTGSLTLGAAGRAVESLQRELRRVGLYDGRMNGQLDQSTFDAVKKLQRQSGAPVTGIIDGREAQALRAHEKFVKDSFVDSPAKLGERGGDIASVEAKLDALGFDPGKVDGIFDKNTLKAVRQFREGAKDVPNHGDSITTRVLHGLTKRIKSTESDLKTLGFKHLGKPDGKFGKNTARAVRAFQKKHHLKVTGEANWKTRHALSKASASAGMFTDGVSPKHFQNGYDVSAWQTTAQVRSLLAKNSTKFLGMKATEGTDYTNPNFKKWWNMAGDKLKPGKLDLRIAYHYLSPGNGRAQADHFLHAVGVHGKLKPGNRLALDWEGPALGSTRSLIDAAKRIHQVTGQWPLVYTSQSQLGRAHAALPHAPIWDAHYPADRSDFKFPFVQTSGSGVDHDFFTGTEAALQKWAGW